MVALGRHRCAAGAGRHLGTFRVIERGGAARGGAGQATCKRDATDVGATLLIERWPWHTDSKLGGWERKGPNSGPRTCKRRRHLGATVG